MSDALYSFSECDEIVQDSRQVVRTRESVWIDGYGRELLVREMTTSHILNCINLLNARHEKLKATTVKFNRSNAVTDYQLRSWEDSIDAFFNELDRRAAASV